MRTHSWTVVSSLSVVAISATAVLIAFMGVLIQDKHDTAIYLHARDASLSQVAMIKGLLLRKNGSSTVSKQLLPASRKNLKALSLGKPTSTTHEPVKPSVTDCSHGVFSAQFLCLLNNLRVQQGKSVVVYVASLSDVATSHSSWMERMGTLSHIGEGGSQFFERCVAHGTTCNAENIAMGFTSASHLFEMWKGSVPHLATMLGPYSVVGLGVSGVYATTIFR